MCLVPLFVLRSALHPLGRDSDFEQMSPRLLGSVKRIVPEMRADFDSSAIHAWMRDVRATYAAFARAR